MSTLAEDVLATEGGPHHMPGIYAAELGPYRTAFRFRIQAYTKHVKGGDPAKASMTLHYQGDEVGSARDENFDRTELKVNYDFFLEAGRTAALRIATENEKATVTGNGFYFWWTQG